MAELLIVAAAVALLGGLSALVLFVPFLWLLFAALACTVGGFLFGVPTGVYYHVVLRRELSRRGPVPPRWWLRPHHFHAELDDDARARVLPFWFMGGAGFLLTMLGFVISVIALATSP